MAGRVTYKYPDEYKDGGWILPFNLPESSKIRLENIIGRPLTIKEINLICKLIANIRFMKTGFTDASMQDVRRTLSSLSRDKNAATAYRNSDTTTQAYIDEALGCDLLLAGQDLLSPTDEDVNLAARIALDNLPRGKGGRPAKFYRIELSRGVEQLWLKFELKPCQAWAWNEKASLKVMFLKKLLILIDGAAIDSKEIVLLFKVLQ